MKHPLRRFAPSPSLYALRAKGGGRSPRGGAARPAPALARLPWLGPRQLRGFTLLELLVVLALMGLAAAVAAPRVLTWAESAQQRALLGSVRTHLQEQPSAAFFAGRTLVLASRPEGWDLPSGWQLYSSQPIVYEANGMTAGGLLELRAGDQVLARWRIEAPSGQVRE